MSPHAPPKKFTVVASISLLFMFSIATPASSSIEQNDYQKDLSQDIVMPYESNADNISIKNGGDIIAEFEGADQVVSIPYDSTGYINLKDEENEISISLPNSTELGNSEASYSKHHDGFMYSSDTEDFSTEVFIKEDASVQLITTIEDESAPTEYTYDMQIPAGATIQKDGESVLIFDLNGEFIGGVSAPWAYDAEGRPVETNFVIHDNKLVQSVLHKEASFAYPITADPYMGKDLIQSVKWVKRAEGFTLQVTPTTWGRTMGSPGGFKAHADELCKRFGECRQHMIWQHQCHIHFAPFKSTWNLDLWKKRSSYNEYVRHLCN